MATTGGSNLGESLYKGSVEDFENACEPCKDDGEFVEASGYCQNCDDYLCVTCMKTHCRPKPCRHHVVLEKQHMPKREPSKSKVKLCTIICKQHPSVCLKFYCTKHNSTGCGDCMIFDHKTCDVVYISTIADGYATNMEYISIIQKLDKLQTEATDKLKDAGQSVKNAEATVEKAIADINKYRKDVNTYFDKVERTLIDKCNEIKKLNQRESKKMCDELKSSSKHLHALYSRLTSNIENTANLFVWTKESQTNLAELESELKAIQKAQHQRVDFIKNAALTTVKTTSATSLGVLQNLNVPVFSRVQRKRMTDMFLKHKTDISVVDSTDTSAIGCYISGMVHVRDNTIACTDWFNKSVKLVDINAGKLVSSASVMNAPWDITSISHNTFAVAITDSRKIQFLEVKKDLISLTNVIDVSGQCRGIDCVDDKLLVSYEQPQKIEILDFHGNVQKRMCSNNNDKNLFKCPYHVAWSHDGSSIYVSDDINKSVTKLSVDGTVLASYKDAEHNSPMGLFVCLDSSVLVCYGNRILVKSHDLQKRKVLCNSNGNVRPAAICCDKEERKLCFSSERSNKISVCTLD